MFAECWNKIQCSIVHVQYQKQNPKLHHVLKYQMDSNILQLVNISEWWNKNSCLIVHNIKKKIRNCIMHCNSKQDQTCLKLLKEWLLLFIKIINNISWKLIFKSNISSGSSRLLVLLKMDFDYLNYLTSIKLNKVNDRNIKSVSNLILKIIWMCGQNNTRY